MRLNFLRLPPFVDRLTAEAVIGAYAKEGISPRLTIRSMCFMNAQKLTHFRRRQHRRSPS